MKRLHWIVLGILSGVGAFYWNQHRETPENLPEPQLVSRLYQGIEDIDAVPQKEDLAKLAEWLEKTPESRKLRLLQAGLNLKFGNTENRILAKRELLKLSDLEDSESYKALQYLAFSPVNQGIFPDDILGACRKLINHPEATPEDQLRATDSMLAVAPNPEKPKWMAATIESHKKDNLELLSQWLLNHSQYPEIDRLISHQQALENEPLFFLKFQALLLMKDIDSASKLLELKRDSLSTYSNLKADAFHDRANGRNEAVGHWVEWSLKNGTPKEMVDAGRFALLSGNAKDALRAYRKVLEDSPEDLESSECTQLLQLALQAKDTPLAYNAAKILHERHPLRPGARNNYIWLALLKGEATEPLLKQALLLNQSGPHNNNFLSTLALAQHLNGQQDQALHTFRKRKGSKQLKTSERALLSAILRAMNKEDEAQRWASGIKEEQLLPEEWALMNR